VTIDGRTRTWVLSGGSCDTATHTYSILYSPSNTGPVRLGVADASLADNHGTLTVTVEPVG
jgi:hypothetical protein